MSKTLNIKRLPQETLTRKEKMLLKINTMKTEKKN